VGHRHSGLSLCTLVHIGGDLVTLRTEVHAKNQVISLGITSTTASTMGSKAARSRGRKAPRRVSSGDLSQSDNGDDNVTEYNTQSASLQDMNVELHKIDDVSYHHPHPKPICS
jgi:hypothetical protein